MGIGIDPKWQGGEKKFYPSGETEPGREEQAYRSPDALSHFLSDADRESLKSQKLLEKFRDILDGKDLLKQEAFYNAIEEAVDKFNAEHGEHLKIATVYSWILDDSEKVKEAITRARGASALRDREEFTNKFEYRAKEKKEGQAPKEIIAFEESINDFLKTVETLNPEGVNIQKLKEFLGLVEKAIRETSLVDYRTDFEKMFRERIRQLKKYPDKASVIISCMISSVHGIYNVALKKTDGLPKRKLTPDGRWYDETEEMSVHYFFDEESVKTDILLDHLLRSERGSIEDRELMSNVDGRIKGLTFLISMTGHHSWFHAPETYYDVIYQLIETKKEEGDFVMKCVYVEESEKINLLRFLAAKRADVSKILFIKAGDIDVSDYYSIWVRDGAVRRNDGTIVEPFTFYFPAVSDAYDSLVPAEGSDLEQSELIFQGGNIRTTESYLFIGYDDIKETARNIFFRVPENLSDDIFERTVKLFEKEFGKEVVVIGEGYQDVFHIDMCVTPLNDRDIIVAEGVEESDASMWLDEIAGDLEGRGFHVTRMPYFSRGGKYVTYNNILFESYMDEKTGEKVKKVYLPQYYSGNVGRPVYSYTVKRYFSDGSFEDEQIDLKQLNEEAVNIYESLGFKVIPVAMSVVFSRGQGALDCITFEDRIK